MRGPIQNFIDRPHGSSSGYFVGCPPCCKFSQAAHERRELHGLWIKRSARTHEIHDFFHRVTEPITINVFAERSIPRLAGLTR